MEKQQNNRYDVRDRWGRFLGPLSNDYPTESVIASANSSLASARVSSMRLENEARRAADVFANHQNSAAARRSAENAAKLAQDAASDVKRRERQLTMLQERVSLIPAIRQRIGNDYHVGIEWLKELSAKRTAARDALKNADSTADLDSLRDAVLQAEWVFDRVDEMTYNASRREADRDRMLTPEGGASIRAEDTRMDKLLKARAVLAQSRYGADGARLLAQAKSLAKIAGLNSPELDVDLGPIDSVVCGGDKRQALAKLLSMRLPTTCCGGWVDAAKTEYAELQKAVPAADASTEQKRAAQETRSKKYGIEALQGKGESLTYPSGYPQSEAQYADPVNLKFPIDTPARASNARVRFSQFAGRYSTDKSRAVVIERIVRAELKFGIKPSYNPESPLDRLLPSDLKDRLSKCDGLEIRDEVMLLGSVKSANDDAERDMLDVPREESVRDAVLQMHFSPHHSGLHCDLCFKLADGIAVGWSLLKSGTVEAFDGEEGARRIVAQAVSDGEGAGDSLPMVCGDMLALPKGRLSDAVLGSDGMVDGKIVVSARKLHVEYGVQQPDFHEYFLTDAETPGVFGGRLVIRQAHGESGPVWHAQMSKDLTPHILSDVAIRSGLTPPFSSISAIPAVLREKTPTEYQYWKAGSDDEARDVRKRVVEAGGIGVLKFSAGQFRVVEKRAQEKRINVQSFNPIYIVGRILSTERVQENVGGNRWQWSVVKVGVPVGGWTAQDQKPLACVVDVNGEQHTPLCIVETNYHFGKDGERDVAVGDVVVLKGSIIAVDRDTDGRYIIDVVGAEIEHESVLGAKPTTLEEVMKAVVVRVSKAQKFKVVGSDQENHYVTGLVLEPNDGTEGAPLDPDTQDDIYSATEIEKAAHKWMREHRQFKIVHRESVKAGEATVVESYLAPAEMAIGETKVRKGTWVVVAEVSGDLWNEIKSGKYNAFSIGGWAAESEA